MVNYRTTRIRSEVPPGFAWQGCFFLSKNYVQFFSDVTITGVPRWYVEQG